MKTKIITLVILGICFFNLSCENDNDERIVNHTEILQPSSNDGVDAFIYDLEPDKNFGTHPDFMAAAWTNGGVEVIVRNFIRFDFSNIPLEASIDSVKLYLFSYNSPSNGSHSTGTPSNSCIIQKVNSTWSEDLITWSNQPSSSNEHQVILSQSQDEIQDYLDIDLTSLAKDMIKTPSINHGFLLKLEKEEKYSRMVFASSDHNNPDLHPKLIVYYSMLE